VTVKMKDVVFLLPSRLVTSLMLIRGSSSVIVATPWLSAINAFAAAGDREVQDAVVVEIPGRHRLRAGAGRVVHGVEERGDDAFVQCFERQLSSRLLAQLPSNGAGATMFDGIEQ